MPRSTVWHNLRALRKIGLIQFGSGREIRISQKEPTIGVVGGFGPETTVEFFSKLLDLGRKNGHKPKLVISNAAVPSEVEECAINGEPEAALPFAKECVQKLNSAGVSFIVIPCNTIHLFFDEFKAISEVPIMSIIDETISELKRRDISCIGLLATSTTVRTRLFQKAFSKNGIRTIVPESAEQKFVSGAIANVLSTGKPSSKDSKNIDSIINKLKKRGAQKILLACTDLQFFVSENPDVIDTLDVLAKAAIRRASEGGTHA
jgi:aspartate racemase